jgi:phage shock protein C
MGVCAGLAEFFDFEAWVVRVLAVASLLFFTTFTAVIYIVMAFLLRDRPLSYRGREEESRFWRGRSSGEHNY